ncbi:Holliday junction branch migration protein RuvA [Oscillospiraceae bacterium MB08-C2-2]|nr:Holliday junction branch migration protein RuvA [Oscillospiraceae bacterium MB08-C2-2]
MFYSLRGTLLFYDTTTAVVECGGVGYSCLTTLSTLQSLPRAGEEVILYTWLSVRENAVDLYGFADLGELDCFKMLIGVTGVGPKVGVSILSALSPERLALAVAGGDYKSITAAQGVGPKLAQRIVLELKDKVKNSDVAKGATQLPGNLNLDAGNAAEAISALVVLGYGQSDAAGVIARLDPATSVSDMVKAGLKALAGR